MINMFPFIFSKFLKNSTAVALITLSSFPAFAMDVDVKEVIQRPSRAKRQVPAAMKKVDFSLQATAAPQSITKGPKGEMKVLTDNNASGNIQVGSTRFPVTVGRMIQVRYNIDVEEGGLVSLGLSNTQNNGYLNEVILQQGRNMNSFEIMVPEGERDSALVFRNAHFRTAAQSAFTINSVDILQEPAIKVPLNDRKDSQAIEQTLDWIKVTSKNTPGVSFLLEGHLLAIAEGERIRVPYDITVEPGAPVSIGLMRTDQAGWLKEVVLNPGSHKEVLEVIVPKGERKTSLQLFKRASGQTKFAINAIDLEKTAGEQKIKASLNDLHTSEAIEQTPDWIKITSQNTPGVSLLLKGDTLAIAEGERIRVPYDITVGPGAPVSIGLMRTDQAGWLKEVVLNPGSHKEVMEVIVPKGETKTSLQLFKRESGQTKFAINAIDLEKTAGEQKIKASLNDLHTSEAIEQTPDWIKITSQNTPGVSFLLEGHLLAIAEGERIRVPYDITVEPGAPVSIGLMRTDQAGWLKEVVLNPGSHKEVLEVIVPKGERKTSLQLFKRASGQTKFAINAIDLEKTAGEQKIKASLNDLHTSEAIEQTPDWIKITSQNTPGVSFLLKGDTLAIAEGERIRVPYDITVGPGAPVSIGLMRTDQAGWLKEVVLNPGPHKEVLEVIVPKGETKASLQLFKRAPGQTKFTVNAIDLEKEEASAKVLTPSIPPLAVAPTASPGPMKVVGRGGPPPPPGGNPALVGKGAPPPPGSAPKSSVPGTPKKDASGKWIIVGDTADPFAEALLKAKEEKRRVAATPPPIAHLDVLAEALSSRRKGIAGEKGEESEDSTRGPSTKTIVESKELTFDEKKQEQRDMILEAQKKITNLEPDSKLNFMPGFSKEINTHNSKRAAAINGITAAKGLIVNYEANILKIEKAEAEALAEKQRVQARVAERSAKIKELASRNITDISLKEAIKQRLAQDVEAKKVAEIATAAKKEANKEPQAPERKLTPEELQAKEAGQFINALAANLAAFNLPKFDMKEPENDKEGSSSDTDEWSD